MKVTKKHLPKGRCFWFCRQGPLWKDEKVIDYFFIRFAKQNFRCERSEQKIGRAARTCTMQGPLRRTGASSKVKVLCECRRPPLYGSSPSIVPPPAIQPKTALASGIGDFLQEPQIVALTDQLYRTRAGEHKLATAQKWCRRVSAE